MFGVSFLQRLPQQMPEMSRCPNDTERSHTEQGSEENNLYPPRPLSSSPGLSPTTNTGPGVPGTAVRSPRRAAPVPGVPRAWGGHGAEGTGPEGMEGGGKEPSPEESWSGRGCP